MKTFLITLALLASFTAFTTAEAVPMSGHPVSAAASVSEQQAKEPSASTDQASTQTATVNTDLSSNPATPSLMPALTVLGVMVLLLVGGTYALKRLGVQGHLPGRGFMKILGVMNLGTREKIALVEIGDTWLVIGMTPSNINTLHTFVKGSITLPADQQAVKSFAELLGRLRKPQSTASP